MTMPKKINEFSYEIKKEKDMNVPVKIFASEKLMKHLEKDISIQQAINVSKLPGIVGWSIMMPDAHQGYGFSIGGVAAFDAETGIVSPGGVGFDINCGVRSIATSLNANEVRNKITELLDSLYKHIPSGLGKESEERLSDEELNDILENGVKALVERGIGTDEDVHFCEAEGKLENANSDFVSRRAKARGRRQLGTLGAGNHFLEVQEVEEIFDEKTAKAFGIKEVGQVLIMIHCGSRGLGHQVASDFLRKIEEEYSDLIEELPEKDLAYAPIQSKLAKEYLGAMAAAANFAWANRHKISHFSKIAFNEVFPEAQFRTIYDVAHNIAKFETHEVNGEKRKLLVHRKGATRAFGPDSPELPKEYQKTGQPILIPGSMGTPSYILVGTKESSKVSFSSTAHGAGRLMSRLEAKKTFNGEELVKELSEQGISIKVGNIRGIGNEAPGAYKDVDEVVKISHEAKIGNLVVKLKPIGVIKG